METRSTEEPTFEHIIIRLQELVEKLEAGDHSLEQSLRMFEEGVQLARLGTERLDQAERKVEYLLSQAQAVQADATGFGGLDTGVGET